MNSSKRREEKKRRREKRLAKKRPSNSGFFDFFENLNSIANVRTPSSFPGACDPSLARPDVLKFEFATFISESSAGGRMREFERNCELGLLHYMPEIKHWAMEEFLWHGPPDQSFDPIDAYLAAHPNRLPPAAQAQMRLWKQARIGLFEIGSHEGNLLDLCERDPITMKPIGQRIRAIALNLGGIYDYTPQRGRFALVYLSPWAPEQNIFCMMGYGGCYTQTQCPLLAPLILGMRNAKAISKPLPWKSGMHELKRWLGTWKKRDWYTWMKEHVSCPFQAVLDIPRIGLRILTIDMMVTESSEEFRRMGLYFAGSITKEEAGAFGASAIVPLDFDSPNAMAFAEYTAFRDEVGPPPATRDW